MTRARHTAAPVAAALVALLLSLLPAASLAQRRPPEIAQNGADHAVTHARPRELLQEGRADEAAELFARLLEERPDDQEAAEGRIRSLLAQDRWRQALEEARGFHAVMPDRPAVVSALGEALMRAGLPEEAMALLEPLAGEASTPARALMALGRLRLARGQLAQGRELIETALQRSPDDRDIVRVAAEVAPSASAAVSRLQRYLELSEGDDPDRIEAVSGTLRVWEELGEREVWINTQRPERLEVPLRLIRAQGGQRLGHVIEVRLAEKGKAVRILLDTGSTGLFLLERIARRHGFQPLASKTVFGGGGGGRHASGRGLFPRFELGDLHFIDALAATTARELEPFGRFHGVLGTHVFEGYEVTLDLDGGRLLLGPPREHMEGSDYWTFAGQMLVRAEASGTSGLFLFDTGASRSTLSTSFAATLEGARLGGASDVRAFGGRVEGARAVHGIRLSLQGLTSSGPFDAVDLSLPSRLGGVEISGYLGRDVLDRARIVIDTQVRRVRLE